MLQQENRELKLKQTAVLESMQDLRLCDEDLRLRSRQSENKLEQLRRHTTLENEPLRQQIENPTSVIQQLQNTHITAMQPAVQQHRRYITRAEVKVQQLWTKSHKS